MALLSPANQMVAARRLREVLFVPNRALLPRNAMLAGEKQKRKEAVILSNCACDAGLPPSYAAVLHVYADTLRVYVESVHLRMAAVHLQTEV